MGLKCFYPLLRNLRFADFIKNWNQVQIFFHIQKCHLSENLSKYELN